MRERRSSQLRGSATAYVAGWKDFQRECDALETDADGASDEYRTSIAVLKTHEDKGHPGGIIASLSIPWGNHKGDHDLGGYHLVWPRDLVESAGGLLAAGDVTGARQTLCHLMSTQEADGHWAQNMWLNGTAYWNGIQMDETGFPILLADLLRRADALDGMNPWSMVRLAASYLVRNGPVTPQDRWEEQGGYSPFTLAVEIAALLGAADFADEAKECRVATFLRETADDWNDHLERWTYVTDSELGKRAGVDGFYARIGPPATDDAIQRYEALVSPDALALVRFGLRAADDPRIANTVRVIDAVLKSETKTGPVWRRYNGDVYGEHADGAPYDGGSAGIGRGWPLLAGERAHYEIAAGRPDEARRLLEVMGRQSSPGGLIPEQIWDGPDVPRRGLFNGRADWSRDATRVGPCRIREVDSLASRRSSIRHAAAAAAAVRARTTAVGVHHVVRQQQAQVHEGRQDTSRVDKGRCARALERRQLAVRMRHAHRRHGCWRLVFRSADQSVAGRSRCAIYAVLDRLAAMGGHGFRGTSRVSSRVCDRHNQSGDADVKRRGTGHNRQRNRRRGSHR